VDVSGHKFERIIVSCCMHVCMNYVLFIFKQRSTVDDKDRQETVYNAMMSNRRVEGAAITCAVPDCQIR
jgi:hypothetical protein